MFLAIAQATMLAFFGTALILIDAAFTPFLGGIFYFVAAAALINAMNNEEVQPQVEPEVVIEGEDLHRNVHFSGRTGSNLVDPRERNLSEDELEKIIQNAQKALKEKGKTANSVTVHRVA